MPSDGPGEERLPYNFRERVVDEVKSDSNSVQNENFCMTTEPFICRNARRGVPLLPDNLGLDLSLDAVEAALHENKGICNPRRGTCDRIDGADQPRWAKFAGFIRATRAIFIGRSGWFPGQASPSDAARRS